MENIENLDKKALNMILYFIERDNCRTSKVGLMKYLFYSDFTFFRDKHKPISGAKYVKLPNGPGLDEWEKYLNFLIRNGYIKPVSKYYITHSGEEKKGDYYEISNGAFSDEDFSSDEIARMDAVYNVLNKFTASALSEMAHKEVAYIEAPSYGDPINYEDAFHINLIDDVDSEQEIIPAEVDERIHELEVLGML